MIETYLAERDTLKCAVMLMDIRRTPGPDEADLKQWFAHYGIPVIYVLTKADKFSKSKQKIHHMKCADALGIDPGDMVPFSAKTRLGKENVWARIEALITNDDE